MKSRYTYTYIKLQEIFSGINIRQRRIINMIIKKDMEKREKKTVFNSIKKEKMTKSILLIRPDFVDIVI